MKARTRLVDSELKEWLLLADQGDPEAQRLLGATYVHGIGVPQDYLKALRWYRRAAAQGHAQAQYSLGVMHAKGRGLPQDYVLAHMWFTLSAAAGVEIALTARDMIKEDITPAQLAEAQRLASEWTPEPEH